MTDGDLFLPSFLSVFYLFSLLRLLPRLQVHLFLPLILLLNLLPFRTQTERVAARPDIIISSSLAFLLLLSSSGDQNRRCRRQSPPNFPAPRAGESNRGDRLFPAASIPYIDPALYLPRRVVATQLTARHHQKSSTTTTVFNERGFGTSSSCTSSPPPLCRRRKDTTKEEGRRSSSSRPRRHYWTTTAKR